MNPKIIGLLFSMILLFLLNSCFYDKADVLITDQNCDTNSYTYSTQVQAIISQYCISCHNSSIANGGVRLDNYDQVKLNADNGNLLGTIRHENGYSAMPKDRPQLNPCDIKIIELWVADGSPNN